MNLPSIYRKQCSGFTSVSNSITTKSGLSVPAIGLITKLLSNKESFIIHKEKERQRSGIGEKSFNKAWAELVDKGFIIAQKHRTRFTVWQYYIINQPDHAQNQDLRNLRMELQYSKSTATLQDLDNQTLTANTGEVGDNINTINEDKNNEDEINEDKNNVREINKVKNPETTAMVTNLTDSVAKQVEFINDSALNLERFILDPSIMKIELTDFEETVERRKEIYLSYWYNKIDFTPINSSKLKVYNDQRYFSCINWIFRRCLMNNNLSLQPERYFDVPINVFIDFIEAIFNYMRNSNPGESVLPINVANAVMEELQPDRNKLSRITGNNSPT